MAKLAAEPSQGARAGPGDDLPEGESAEEAERGEHVVRNGQDGGVGDRPAHEDAPAPERVDEAAAHLQERAGEVCAGEARQDGDGEQCAHEANEHTARERGGAGIGADVGRDARFLVHDAT